MKTVPFILRDHRDQLWRRWTESLGEDVPADYRELMSSPLGERFVRAFVDDLMAWSEAEEYEAPTQLRQACERVGADALHRMALGFTALELAAALQALRGSPALRHTCSKNSSLSQPHSVATCGSSTPD